MPPRPEIVTPNASSEEAAAVVAALEQFMRNHAVTVVAESGPQLSPWKAAALREGVDRSGWVGPIAPPFWA